MVCPWGEKGAAASNKDGEVSLLTFLCDAMHISCVKVHTCSAIFIMIYI